MAKFIFNDGKAFSGGYDLSSHITSVNLEITADELDATTINSGGFRSKLGGLKDSTLQLDGFYEAGANQPDALLGASVGNELIVTTVPDAGVGNTAYFMKSRLFSYNLFGAVGEIAPFSISKSQSSDVVVQGNIQIDSALTATGNSPGVQLGAVGATENVMQQYIVMVLVVHQHQQLLLNYKVMTILVLQVQQIELHLQELLQ